MQEGGLRSLSIIRWRVQLKTDHVPASGRRDNLLNHSPNFLDRQGFAIRETITGASASETPDKDLKEGKGQVGSQLDLVGSSTP